MTKNRPPRQGRVAQRGTILALTAASALVIGVAGWPDSGDASGTSPEHVELARSLPSSELEFLQTAISGDLTAFDVDVTLPLEFQATDGFAANSVQKAQKKIDKLQAKIAKKEAKIAEKEGLITDAESEIAAQTDALAEAESDLADAEAMPEDTPEELAAKKAALKAANKAVKSATKALGKQQKKVAKLDKQVDKLGTSIDGLETTVSQLEDVLYGGTGGTEVPGLALPDRLDVMATSSSGGGGGGSGFLPGAPGAGGSGVLPDFPPQSAYFTDPVNTFVWDPSTEALEMVNSILCQLRQTAAEAMVNQGAYVAQIDVGACEQGSDTSSGSSGTGQSTSQTEDFEFWTVTSQRADENSPHYVKVWIPNDDGGDGGDGGGGGTASGPNSQEPDGMLIHVLITVEEGESELNPFGKFHLDFALAEDGDVGTPYFWGTLNTQDALEGFMGFTFYQTSGESLDPDFPYYENRQVHVNMFTDGSQGVAHVKEAYGYPSFEPGHEGELVEEAREYVLAFDDANMLRAKDDDEPECLSRTDFDTNVWRYALYNASGDEAGERVERNSGFGIRTADNFHGWAGYWGIWLPFESEVADGDTVFKDSYGDPEAQPEEYTVFVAPGKLFRNSRQDLTLAEIDGVEFEWWYWPAPTGGGGDPGGGDPPPPPGSGPSEPQQLLISYISGEDAWFKVGQWDNESGGYELLAEEDYEVLDFQALGVNWVGMWSQSLGGSVNYIPGETVLTSYKEEIVRASDPVFEGGPLELVGFTQMLQSGLTGDDASAGDIYLDDSYDLGTPHHVVFDPSDMTLYRDVDGDGLVLEAAGLADGETYTDGPYNWGMRSGPMLATTDGMESVFDSWNQEVFYVYETGPNEWNQFIGLVDSQDQAVVFDPPIQFKYTHSQEADLNGSDQWAGKSFLLEYNGDGDLWGLPHGGVDTDDDGFPDRWYPLVNLADGVLMGPTGGEYVVRAWEQEQTLLEDPGGCFNLNVDTVWNLPLPDGSTYETPYIGKEPQVDDAPAVVAGEPVGGS